MSCVEHALTFGCAGDALVGIVSLPAPVDANAVPAAGAESADVGMVIIVGGPQYRAGSHRQFTLLARAVAEAGYPVLRFDYRGMGDSTGAQRNFEAVNDDVAAAIDELMRRFPTLRRVVLWGLCDGASAALLYLHATQDRRVRGLCIANPWVRTEAGLARTHVKHYYLKRLRQPDFWRKAICGRVAGKAASDLWRNLSVSRVRPDDKSPGATFGQDAPFQDRMYEAAAWFDGELLLLISGNDLTAKEFLGHVQDHPHWQPVLSRTRCTCVTFADGDHTFSNVDDERSLHRTVVRWLAQLAAAQPIAA